MLVTGPAEKETSGREKANVRTKLVGLHIKLAVIGRCNHSSVLGRDSGGN